MHNFATKIMVEVIMPRESPNFQSIKMGTFWTEVFFFSWPIIGFCQYDALDEDVEKDEKVDWKSVGIWCKDDFSSFREHHQYVFSILMEFQKLFHKSRIGGSFLVVSMT